MFIYLFTDSALRFPLGYVSTLGVKFYIFRDSIYFVARRVNVPIDFNRVGIASGGIGLPYCYCMI